MKNPRILVLISIIFVLCLCCRGEVDASIENTGQTAENYSSSAPDESDHNSPGNEICRVPRCLEELNKFTGLTVDLTNDCSFQPVHMQVREGDNISTEIIGRFFGHKVDKGKRFVLDSVQFKHFELSSNPRAVLIDTAIVKDSMGILKFEMKLIDLNDCRECTVCPDNFPDCTDCEERPHWEKRIEVWKKNRIDYTIQKKNIPKDLEIKDKKEIDVHICNETSFYPSDGFTSSDGSIRPLESEDCMNVDISYPRGRHCRGIARIN